MRKYEAYNLRRGDDVQVFVDPVIWPKSDGWADGVVSKGAYFGDAGDVVVNVRIKPGVLKQVRHKNVRWARRNPQVIL